MLINTILSCIVVALVYKLKREKDFFAETIRYYSDLSASLSGDLQQQKQLASELAHDLKSPLAGIVSSAESLNLVATEMPAAYHECIKLMRDSGRTNLRLVTNFIEFIADRKVEISKASLPKNRKDIFIGLLASEQLNSDCFEWQALDFHPKLKIALRPFACAFAELCDFALIEAKSKNQKLRVVEFFNQDNSELVLTLTPTPNFNCLEAKSHYALALRVLDRLGASFVEGNCSELGSFVDLHIPTYSQDPDLVTADNVKLKLDMQRAEALMLSSVQQVHSAKLSVASLKDLDPVGDSSSDLSSKVLEKGLSSSS